MTLDHIIGDLRVVIRSLRRSRGFTTVVTATLAIGIGAITALFSAIYSYAYRPLPYVDSDRIIAVQEHVPRHFFVPQQLSRDAAEAVLQGTKSFERVALLRPGYSKYSIGDRSTDLSTDLSTLWIDSSFAPLFMLQPQLGRNLSADEIRSGAPSALISDALWRSTFGQDPAVVGKFLRVGDTIVTIVGVMPKGFRYPLRTNVWRPLRSGDSTDGTVTLLGKLKPGVTSSRVAGELALIAKRLAESDSVQFSRVSLLPLEMVDRGVGAALRIALLFVGAAAFVLFIACANVANLFLVRGAERRGEMSIRASLGATKARLVMRGLLEALVLSGFASLIGYALSVVMVKIGLSFVPGDGLPSWVRFDVDGRILAFTCLVCVGVTLAVGMAPALEAARPDLMRMLKSGGDRSLSRNGVSKRARAGIVVQLTLSVVLLVASLLFAQTYRRISTVDLGYPAAQIAELRFYFNDARYASDTMQLAFAKDVLRRAQVLPGALGAAVRGGTNTASLAGATASRNASRRGLPRALPDTRLFVDGELPRSDISLQSPAARFRFFSVSADYFRVLGLRVVAGRSLPASDAVSGEKVAVVSRRFSELLWPHANPVGHTIRFGPNGVSIGVVGVVEDVRDVTSGKGGIFASPRADVYFSVDQTPAYNPTVLVRSAGDPRNFRIAAETFARTLDPTMEVGFATLDEQIKGVQLQAKFFGGLLFAFAISGLILSVIGIYGIVAYGITERTREIGIRIALGGTPAEVLQMVLRSSLRFIGLGLAIGLVVSQGTNRLLGILLFGVSAADPLTYSIVCLAFGAVALLAAYLPARRVLRVDPIIALRAE